MMKEWWRKATVYQIYPKSFNDTTGNGIGDIKGIIEKLAYLNELGVDVIWLTPIYKSPQKDNGYDISDYYSIDEEYGSMRDFEDLVAAAHEHGIRIIMDLVVNHTSTEHEWFKRALESDDSRFRDFYIWRDPIDGHEPNNWLSKFGGSAWKLDEKSGKYYLHLFDETQADLNWENPQVRQEIYKLMHYWFEKGIDGFRLDVINLISKNQQFPNDDGTLAPGDGRKFYTDGPRVHEFLHEMNQSVLSNYDSMTVGEMSSTTIEDCISYSSPERNELSMTFNFHHLKVDYPNGEKWAVGEFDFLSLKQILSMWQMEMHQGGGWNALFWSNHDQPRIVSRYGDDALYHQESAKMLATTIHMMQGTPFIYQGEEFGMTNPNFDRIEQYRDVETLNYFRIMKKQGMSEQEIYCILQQKSRDNSRTPVQWNELKEAGFTKGTPWIPVAENYRDINAAQALNDQDSIFYHYKKLIQLRKEYEIITSGDYKIIQSEHPELFIYVRSYRDEQLLVVNNFYAKDTKLILPAELLNNESETILIGNYSHSLPLCRKMEIRPYESVVYHLKKKW
ncbi:alpha,alpha-phosphotrehalase [Peribacillus butanolivorans]|uniref:Alpha,alpha-phosphotrehalase n=1 Tax=Peribacillus butanolivorans TaxID=421767 RepID=A0ABM6XMV9_9BACI|nr:alpha,alpha-phosphotrehalase [Peribacillus butanolivorans]AXN39448.1 alpha,alpha-phosphotrehalase [Peribacillus butanolivorans]